MSGAHSAALYTSARRTQPKQLKWWDISNPVDYLTPSIDDACTFGGL